MVALTYVSAQNDISVKKRGRSLANNWCISRYLPISKYFSRFMANTDKTDIQSSRYIFEYRCSFSDIQFADTNISIAICIAQIYRLPIYQSNPNNNSCLCIGSATLLERIRPAHVHSSDQLSEISNEIFSSPANWYIKGVIIR